PAPSLAFDAAARLVSGGGRGGRAGSLRRRRCACCELVRPARGRQRGGASVRAWLPPFVSVARGSVGLYLSQHKAGARPHTLLHLYVDDIDAVSEAFGIPVDEEGLAGRECDLVDPDGNRLRVATRRP